MTAEYDSALAALQEATEASLAFIDVSQTLAEEVANKMTTIDDTLTSALTSSEQSLQSYLSSSQTALTDSLASNQTSLETALSTSQTTLDAHLFSVSRHNLLINGKPQIWQRGESFTATDVTSLYTADRWLTVLNNATCTKHTLPTGGILLNVDAEGGFGQLHQLIESATVQLLREKTLTFSVHYGVNEVFTGDMQLAVFYSNLGDTQASVLIDDASAIATYNFTPVADVAGTESVSFTVPVDAVGLRVTMRPVEPQTIGSAMALYHAQLEVGATASAFEVTPYGEEYQKCLRYYYNHTGAHYTQYFNTSYYISDVYFPVVMRAIPSVEAVFPNGSFDIALQSLDSASKFHMNSGTTGNYISGYTADAEL